jgi:hypothetical protein
MRRWERVKEEEYPVVEFVKEEEEALKSLLELSDMWKWNMEIRNSERSMHGENSVDNASMHGENSVDDTNRKKENKNEGMLEEKNLPESERSTQDDEEEMNDTPIDIHNNKPYSRSVENPTDAKLTPNMPRIVEESYIEETTPNKLEHKTIEESDAEDELDTINSPSQKRITVIEESPAKRTHTEQKYNSFFSINTEYSFSLEMYRMIAILKL